MKLPHELALNFSTIQLHLPIDRQLDCHFFRYTQRKILRIMTDFLPTCNYINLSPELSYCIKKEVCWLRKYNCLLYILLHNCREMFPKSSQCFWKGQLPHRIVHLPKNLSRTLVGCEQPILSTNSFMYPISPFSSSDGLRCSI